MTRRRGRRRSAWTAAALFLASLVVYVSTTATDYANPDAYSSSLAAWRIANTGAPWMESIAFDELEGVENTARWQINGRDGHLVTGRQAGPILAAVPFYAVNPDPDEESFSVFRGGMAASTMVAGAVALLFLALRRHVSERLAVAGALVFAFTTPTWSTAANALWTHPMTLLGLAGSAWALSRDRWWQSGIWLGVAMLARPHLALVAAVVGLGLAWARRDVRPALGVAMPTAGSLAVLSAWNKFVFGSWDLRGGYADYGYMQDIGAGGGSGLEGSLLNAAGFLVSPDRGLLVWSPMILLLLPAVVRSWRSLPAWTRLLALGGVVYSIAQVRLNAFMGGDGFYGYRLALELLTCLAPALVLSVGATGRVSRWLLPPVIALQFAAISVGASVESFYVLVTRAWVDNSFWFAITVNPGLILTYTAVLVGLGCLVSLRLNRSASADRGGS